MPEEPNNIIRIFYCYAHEDRVLRDQLEKHLSSLKRTGQFVDWYDREIPPGSEWEPKIDLHLDAADIVLLLISSDFMSSEYCYSKEMQRALERYREGKCRVIPIILRPVLIKGTFINELQQLPSEGKPVTSWPNSDIAFENVANGIYNIIERMQKVGKSQFKKKEVEQAKRAELNFRDLRKQRRENLLQKKTYNRPSPKPPNEISANETSFVPYASFNVEPTARRITGQLPRPSRSSSEDDDFYTPPRSTRRITGQYPRPSNLPSEDDDAIPPRMIRRASRQIPQPRRPQNTSNYQVSNNRLYQPYRIKITKLVLFCTGVLGLLILLVFLLIGSLSYWFYGLGLICIILIIFSIRLR